MREWDEYIKFNTGVTYSENWILKKHRSNMYSNTWESDPSHHMVSFYKMRGWVKSYLTCADMQRRE
jgi:hypothetical protein